LSAPEKTDIINMLKQFGALDGGSNSIFPNQQTNNLPYYNPLAAWI
jgi:hypothetical protein